MRSVPQAMLFDLAALFGCDTATDRVTEIRVGPMSATLTKLALRDGKPYKVEGDEIAMDTITIPVDPYYERGTQ